MCILSEKGLRICQMLSTLLESYGSRYYESNLARKTLEYLVIYRNSITGYNSDILNLSLVFPVPNHFRSSFLSNVQHLHIAKESKTQASNSFFYVSTYRVFIVPHQYNSKFWFHFRQLISLIVNRFFISRSLFIHLL